MLTVKAPIALKCDRMMAPSHEAFYHRITDNYRLMTADITGEDLLHVVTAPPEVYLGEGGMTSIVNQNQVQNIHQINLEVINNLLNRIALTEDVDLTYQDRVYITRVLNKLGIKNVQEFMREADRIRQETNLTEQLISLYWNHADELSWILDTYQNLRRDMHLTEQETQETELSSYTQLHLHEDIMNRLQTGAIYQILSNFYAGHAAANTYVTSQELQISEQKRTASQILLTRLKNLVRDGQQPLVYRHENYYENIELGERETKSETVKEQITSAVLLGLVDNLYFSRFQRQQQNFDSWISVQNALYQSAQNTIYRLRMQSDSVQNVQNRRELSVYRQDLQRMELFSTLQLLEPEPGEEPEEERAEAPSSGELRELRDFYERVETYLQTERAVVRSTQTEFVRAETEFQTEEIPEGREQPGQAEGGLPSVRQTVYQQEVTNRLLTQEFESPLEQLREVRQLQETVREAREPEYIREEGDSYTYLTEGEEPQEAAPEREESEQILEELRRIDQQNIENYHYYRQQLAARESQISGKKRERPEQRMRKESLIALENPQQMMEEYRQEQQEEARLRDERIREMIRLLPEQTRRVYERLEQYRENPERFRGSGEISSGNVGLLMRDIQEIEREHVISRQAEEEEAAREVIREVSGDVLERLAEQPQERGRTRRLEELSQTDVELVHRLAENTLDEEFLTQLLEQNRSHTEQKTVTENVYREEQTVNRTVQEVNRQTQVEQQNINDMIRQSIQSQIRPLSEQVYSRLEKRLQNEKRRRGY